MSNLGPPPLPVPRSSYRSAGAPYVFVSVADMRLSKAPDAVVSTLGLGSCLGITVYDSFRKVGGLLHVMLPDSRKHRPENPITAMYLDLGLPTLLEAVVNLGADRRTLEFKIFGGAQILQSNDYFSIGRQNVEMMRALAAHYRLTVKAWEVGGQCNRSIELYLRDGRVLMRMPAKGDSWI